MIHDILARIRAARLRRQLRKIDDWCGQLEDQVQSGQQALRYWQQRRAIVQARLNATDTASGYLRGVGA